MLYTPFFERGTAKMAEQMLSQRADQLVKDAYMGNPEALGQLYQVDPRKASEISQVTRQIAQTRLAARAADDRRNQQEQENRLSQAEFLDEVESELANFENIEDASAHMQRRVSRAYPDLQIPDLTEEAFAQIKEANAPEEDYNKPFLSDGTPNVEYQKWVLSQNGPGQRDDKINAIEQQLIQAGMPAEEAAVKAINVVDGNIRYEVTEQGKVLEINEIDGSTREIPIGGAQQENPGINDQSFSLYGMSDDVSGIEPSVKALGAKVSAMFGIEAFPDTVTSRQIAEGAMQGLVRALSINDRYPVREIERIREDMGKISPTIFSGGPEVRSQMKGLNTLLTNTLEQAQQDSNNPQMPTDIRAGAARAANDISNFLDVMGYVDTEMLNSPNVVMNVPLSSLEQYVRITDESELNSLPPEVEEAIFERLSGRK